MKEEIIYTSMYHESDILNIEMAGITYPDSNYVITRNNSNIYVFEFIIDGSGYIECDNHTNKVKKGDFYLLKKNSTHKYYSDKLDPYKKLWFNADGKLLDNLLDVYSLNKNVIIQNINVYSIFKDLHDMLKQNYSHIDMQNVLALKIHELIIAVDNSLNKNKIINDNTAYKIKTLLDKSIYKNISLDELVNKLYISKVQIIRIFKNEYNQTPYAYILNKKIDVSKKLLMNTNMRIKDIASKLCFADEHYFSNVFKKVTGFSPSKYKNNNL